jgi:hypothetical protein
MKPIFCFLVAFCATVTISTNVSAQANNKPPTQEEVRQYFFKQAKESADFYHHTNVKVEFTKYQQAAPAPYKFSVGTKTCYAVKIDWVSSNDFEGTSFVGTYTGDLYRFYRNEFGDLEVGNHMPGNLVSTTHPAK